jgi:hypothetical protein
MLIVLIVIPAIIVAVGVVLLLDRVGVLPRLDGGSSSYSSRSSGGGFMDSIPTGAWWGAGGLMILWILAWLIFLIIGLSMLAG